MSEFINITIGDCCEILDSFRIPLNEEERNKIPGNIPYYGANGVQGYIDKYIFDEDLILIAEDGGNFESYKTKPIAYRITGKSWVNNHAHILRAKKCYNQDYIFYSLVNKNILNFIVGGTRSKLNQRELKTISILIPPQKSEQTAIAHILSTVDKAIEQTEKLIAKYKRIKTGLMQDLLTKGIDENGNIRSEKTHKFKDSPLGRIPVEWEVKQISEICEVVSGGTPNTKNSNLWNGDIIWITPNDLNKLSTPFISDSERKITKEGIESSSAKLFPPLSIIISTRAPIGYLALNKIPAATNQGCKTLVFSPTSNKNSLFFYYLISHNINSLLTRGNGTTFTEISKKDLNKIELAYPIKLEEQIIIAEKLSSVENKINIESYSLSKFTKLKSGLMQDLLTSRVRVPEELIEEIKKNLAR